MKIPAGVALIVAGYLAAKMAQDLKPRRASRFNWFRL